MTEATEPIGSAAERDDAPVVDAPGVDYRPAKERSLADKTTSGFVWLMAQTVGSKMVNMVGQVVLAWMLSPDHFGLIALVYTVTGFASLIQQAGLREILIHRHEHFDRWANPAFWMSLTLGCVGAAVMVALAPVAANVYGEPQIIPLILVLAATAPFTGLDIVPDAKLTSELRFGFLATVKWLTAVGTMALSIIFAKLLPDSHKAFAFVLPVPIITAMRLVMLWSATRPGVKKRLDFRRWKYLISDSALLFMAAFFVMLTWQGDYMMLGVFHDAKTVGIYFFAFNLSIQTMQVFTQNLCGVLFPALSKLQDDPKHQTRAFHHAAELLAIIGVPLSLGQAALAGPAISLLFNSWWEPMIRVLQFLSIGMAVRLVASPAGSLMQAQGRFKTYLLTNAVNAMVFLALVAGGAVLGAKYHGRVPWLAKELEAAVFVAIAVAVYFTLIGPIFMYVAIKPGGGTWRDIFRIYVPPLAASAVAIGTAILLGRLVPQLGPGYRTRHVARIAVILMWSIPLYVPLIRWMTPKATEALINRLSTLLRRGNSRQPRVATT